MVLVRVYRISSMRDPETGRRGKIIELVEERKVVREVGTRGLTEDSFMVHQMLQDMLSHLQDLGLMPYIREPVKPKMTLYLSEEEYEILGIRLEVNEVYELEFKDGAIIFKKAYD
jgi:hypothetical protein